MHLQELSSLPFVAPIIFLQLFVPCIGFLFPSALLSRLLPSLSRHYKIVNLPIFVIFSLLIVSLVHFTLLTNISSLFLSLNLPKRVDLFFCYSNYLEFSSSCSPYFLLHYFVSL